MIASLQFFPNPVNNTLSSLYSPANTSFKCIFSYSTIKVAAYLNIVDIAGLVKGAHEGQGLGNAFLSHIRSVDALYHLCRKE